MNSKDNKNWADGLEVSIQAFLPKKFSEKINAFALIVEIGLKPGIFRQINPKGKKIYIIVDLSDSARPAFNQMTAGLREIFKRVEPENDRVLIYPLGKEYPVANLPGNTSVNEWINALQRVAQTGEYYKIGTFIEPTLQAIKAHYARGESEDANPPVVILSDGEIWDGDNYQKFVEAKSQFRFGFLELARSDNAKKIPESAKIPKNVQEVNTQNVVISCDTAQGLGELLSVSQNLALEEVEFAIEQLFFDAASMRVESMCVLDFHDMENIRKLDNTGLEFQWTKTHDHPAEMRLRRLFLFHPQNKPVEMSISSRGRNGKKYSIDWQSNSNLMRSHEKLRIQAEQICLPAWNIKLIRKLIDATIGEQYAASKKDFEIKCPNPSDKGVINEPDDWIAKTNRTVQCRSCKQILLHAGTLTPLDPELAGANALLLKFLPATDPANDKIDEPVFLKVDQNTRFEMDNFFKVYRNKTGQAWEIEVLRGEVEHHILDTKGSHFKYEAQTKFPAVLQSFDVIKAHDAANQEIYYMFLDVSKIA